MDTKYLPVDWASYHDYVRMLCEAILSHSQKIDQIVAISRGGLTLGHLMADSLHIPVAVFTIQSYTDIKKQGVVKITEPLKSPIRGKHILLADDVSDSGTTLKRALSYLKRFKPKKITTATMFFKPRSSYKPDFFVKETSRWILFPYEPTEMIQGITKSMEKEGKSQAEIQNKLTSLGYTPNQIRFVRKWYLQQV